MREKAVRNVALIFLILGLITAAYLGWIVSASDPCRPICRSCDMAIWRAVELKLDDPMLFERDRLFMAQWPLFPRTFSRGMNALHRITHDPNRSDLLARLVLGVLFVTGLGALTQAVTGNQLVTAVLIGFAMFGPRLPLSGAPGWGMPNLKPVEVIGAATPWLLWLLWRSLTRDAAIGVFSLAAAALFYIHPPSAAALLVVGFVIHLGLTWTRPGRVRRVVLAVVPAAIVLIPFLSSELRAASDAGPPLSILLERAPYSFFPTKATVALLFGQLLVPLAAAFVFRRWVNDLPPAARRFLLALVLAGGALSLLSALTWVMTPLARFVLPGSSRFIFWPTCVVIAFALVNWRRLAAPSRGILVVTVAIMAFNLDHAAMMALQEWRHRSDAKGATGANAESDACNLAEAGRWAEKETDPRALFIVPPKEVDAGFRVLSHRGVVVVDKDGGNAKYGRTIAVEWRTRMDAVTAAYASGDPTALLDVARTYGAQYILERRPDADGETGDAVYWNERWIIRPTGVLFDKLVR